MDKAALADLVANSQIAESLADSRRRSTIRIVVPWGWRHNKFDGKTQFFDDIVALGRGEPPPQSLHASTLTIMAQDVDHCIEKLVKLKTQWLSLVSKNVREKLSKVLHSAEILSSIHDIREQILQIRTLWP